MSNLKPKESKETCLADNSCYGCPQEPALDETQDHHDISPSGRGTTGEEGRKCRHSTGTRAWNPPREKSEREGLGTQHGQYQEDPEKQLKEEAARERGTSESAETSK